MPHSTTFPSSITAIRSAFLTVDRRWAMISVVLPFVRRSSASNRSPSVPASKADVGSSRISTGAFLQKGSSDR